jgi:hypothetical protein
MTEGNYEIVLLRIFLYLDGKSLTASAKVCSLWRVFMVDNIWR